MSIKGWPDQEKIQDGKGEHATISPIRTQQHGLDVRAHITAYQLDTGTIQAGSTTRIIETDFSETARKGDIVVFSDGTNEGHEAVVLSASGTTITLVERLPATPGTGNAIRLLRQKTLEVTSTGGLPSSLSFVLDGSNQTVTEDTVTPANNRPLPVKLTGFDGDVAINAANLNMEVQLTAAGADHDSVRIGDGTETLAISPDGGAQIAGSNNSVLRQGTGASVTGSLNVHVGGIEGSAFNYGANTTAFRTAAQIGNATGVADFNAGNASAQTLRTVIATDQAAIPVSQSGSWSVDVASSALPTGAATEATLSTVAGDTTSLDTKAVQQTLDSGASSAALLVTTSTRQEAAATPLSNRLSDGTSFYKTVESTQLPASLGQAAAAGSVSVVLASDQGTVPTKAAGRSVVDKVIHSYSSVNVTTGAYVTLIASTAGAITRLHIFDSSGEGIILATGAAASEVDLLYIQPGGFDAPVEVSISSATRLSIKALTANATAGNLILNALS